MVRTGSLILGTQPPAKARIPAVTSATPDWYDDPERPGEKRYWDGFAWTEHRTDYATSGAPAQTVNRAAFAPEAQPLEGGASFALVVAGVLGGAVALIAFIVVVVVWFDSYNTGHARGVAAHERGVPSSSASAYCESAAKDITAPGSAAGYWDFAWVSGCKRGLG
jgi:hypothetical protein